MPRELDPHLLAALSKAYMARAKLFHAGVKQSKIDLLIAEIDAIDGDTLAWAEDDGVSMTALEKVRVSGGVPHQVFAHPQLIQERPHLIAYYRNLVAISKKGVNQILFATGTYEARRNTNISPERAHELCVTLNRIISDVINEFDGYSVDLSRQVILAEIGTQLQGTWANQIGRGAAKAVEELLNEYVQLRNLGEQVRSGHFILGNGWTIAFASEPDIAFIDAQERTQIVVEIKGSLDKAGAQSRYGEAKKTFAKAIADNPRCFTVYLASCFTSSVIDQITADGQVRAWFNLTSILYDEGERDRFLESLFHVVNTPR